MSDFSIAARTSIDSLVKWPPVLAWLGRRDFVRAQFTARSFSQWSDHDDFTAERDALYIGYGAAGMTALRQRVPYDAFERWSRLTGAPVDIEALDEFAAHWRWRLEHPDCAVIGCFGAPGDAKRNVIAAADAERVIVRPDVYIGWCEGYEKAKLLPAPDLDVYAAHVVECCFPSARRARTPAVSSS